MQRSETTWIERWRYLVDVGADQLATIADVVESIPLDDGLRLELGTGFAGRPGWRFGWLSGNAGLRYTAELGDVKDLRSLLTALRNLEAVFDAYRVTPN